MTSVMLMLAAHFSGNWVLPVLLLLPSGCLCPRGLCILLGDILVGLLPIDQHRFLLADSEERVCSGRSSLISVA